MTLAADIVTYRGKDGVRKYHRELLEVWADCSARAESFEDLGDRVLVRVKASEVGKLGGVPAEMTVWHLWEVREGRSSASAATRPRPRHARRHRPRASLTSKADALASTGPRP